MPEFPVLTEITCKPARAANTRSYYYALLLTNLIRCSLFRNENFGRDSRPVDKGIDPDPGLCSKTNDFGSFC